MGAYAQIGGVDYQKIDPFKRAMIEVAKQTFALPNSRGVYVIEGLAHAHGGPFMVEKQPSILVQTTEGLGNKNWIAEWMYANADTDKPYYHLIGVDTVMMAVNDVIAQGALPVTYTDEVAAGDSDWFTTKQAQDLSVGFLKGCRLAGCALVAGESPALKYLVRAKPPVASAPVLSGTVIGLIHPVQNLIDGSKLQAGDRIIGVNSTGLHANGISLVIGKVMNLPGQFLTGLPNGSTVGDEALIPTRCYVDLVEALLCLKVDIHCIVPGTGSGVSKVAFDDRPFTYRIHSWPEVPILFQFMRDLGVSLIDCLTTFNWGVGYYIIVPPSEVERTIKIGQSAGAGYELMEIGIVEEGERQVIFGPESDLFLPPPGD